MVHSQKTPQLVNNKAKNPSPRILFWDIETAPTLAWVWRTGKQWVDHSQIKKGTKPSDIICICYKWLDEKTIHSLDWGLKKQDSGKMLNQFTRVLEQADLAIGHNIDRFDLRHLQTQRLMHNQDPIALPTTEDTLKQARKHFYFPSYKLDYLAKQLTGSGKDSMVFQDWIDIVESKDATALAKMIKYCKKDVLKLEQVWKKLAPHTSPKIHAGIAKHGSRESCPRCASEEYQHMGFAIRKAGRYQRYRCLSCYHVWRDTRKA